MHEAFDKNDPSKFTRKWFVGKFIVRELIVKLSQERPQILWRG
jgi:meiotically up-regulated gene 157 (Mug157) protein